MSMAKAQGYLDQAKTQNKLAGTALFQAISNIVLGLVNVVLGSLYLLGNIHTAYPWVGFILLTIGIAWFIPAVVWIRTRRKYLEIEKVYMDLHEKELGNFPPYPRSDAYDYDESSKKDYR